MELIEQFENEWVFQDPTITPAIDDEFEEALEASRRGDHRAAERIARAVVRRCPNHVDALHHLAIWIKERTDIVTAYAFCQAAVSIGLHAIPPEFHWDRSRLTWGHLENRPFMRAYHNLAIHRMEQQAWEAAIEILSRLLAVNPNDNQGVRYELPGCWFETGNIAAVIEHCRRHDDDASPLMLYSNALAHVLADDTPAAQSALKHAILAQPLVAKELLADRHPEPQRSYPGTYTIGGRAEAWDYWKLNGEYWRRSDTATALLRRILDENTH